MTEQIHTTQPSLAALQAQVALLEAEAANVTREMCRPVIEHLLTSHTCVESKSSPWVGFSTEALSITVDGRKVSFKIVVTDTVATDARKDTANVTKRTKEMAALQAKLDALKAPTA